MSGEYLQESVFFEFEHEGQRFKILDTQLKGKFLLELQHWEEQHLVNYGAKVLETRDELLTEVERFVHRLEDLLRKRGQ